MSYRYGSAWISGAYVFGNGGLGVLGSLIPSTGDSGAGYCYNDLSLPADNDKEICGRITTWPTAGTLVTYEDTSFTYTPAGDGAQSFQYQLYVDGVAIGSPTTVSLYSGATTTTATISTTDSSDTGGSSEIVSAIGRMGLGGDDVPRYEIWEAPLYPKKKEAPGEKTTGNEPNTKQVKSVKAEAKQALPIEPGIQQKAIQRFTEQEIEDDDEDVLLLAA